MLEITPVANVLGKQDMGVNEMAQSAKALANNHDDMSSMPWTTWWMGRTNSSNLSTDNHRCINPPT